jgi:hypothetical protein
MSPIVRLALSLLVLAGLAVGVVAYATAGPPNHANRLEATFTETVKVVVSDNLPTYGIGLAILTGSGTLDGFGTATETGGVVFDRTVQPCGIPSESAAIVRRIVTADGILAIRESNHTCLTPARIATGTFDVDGLFSTGVFAGATGSGSVVNLLGPHTLTLSGKLNLANEAG